METLLFKATWQYLSSHSHPTKTLQALTRTKKLQFGHSKKQGQFPKDMKYKCPICGNHKYEHILMLIIHLEVLHPHYVDKYCITGEIVTVVENQPSKNRGDPKNQEIAHNFIQHLGHFDGIGGIRSFKQPFCMKDKMESRVKEILNVVGGKLERALHKKEQVYFHSTDIFRQIDEEHIGEDSEQELGEVEKELQKLRIEDFGDVNNNDKKFFIEWNGFIHEKRKESQIIFSFQIPKIFVEFCSTIREKGLPRVNLVMHAWTLWSSGQIASSDIIKGLKAYDGEYQQS